MVVTKKNAGVWIVALYSVFQLFHNLCEIMYHLHNLKILQQLTVAFNVVILTH